MEEEEHEVYGGDIPDVEGDVDPHNADVEMSTADDDAVKELDEMKKRLKEMEEEAAALREMQAKVEKEMGAVQDPAGAAASQASREEVDTRSIFVGNDATNFSIAPEFFTLPLINMEVVSFFFMQMYLHVSKVHVKYERWDGGEKYVTLPFQKKRMKKETKKKEEKKRKKETRKKGKKKKKCLKVNILRKKNKKEKLYEKRKFEGFKCDVVKHMWKHNAIQSISSV